ncbi:MAG: C39 family peptidase [Parcubacteria group bacterium]
MLPKPFSPLRSLFKKVSVLLSILIFIPLLLVSFRPGVTGADTTTDLLKQIDSYKKKLSELSSQKDTLANQIAYLDNQVSLTQLEIQAKGEEIKLLSGDIGDLSIRLERIGNFLDYQEEIFANRARLAYASDQLSSFDIVLGAENLDDALRRIKYLRVLEDQDVQSLTEIRDIRTGFKEQKTTLENKKSSVEKLRKELDQKEDSLAQQKSAKQNLLAVTRNSEQDYQRLLKEAQSQLEAIRRAVSLRKGYTPLYNQTYCNSWGCYYNQRDAQWFYLPLGYSRLSVGEYGCLVTSMAMVASHYGKNIRPSDIALTPSAFFSNTAYLYYTFTVKGVTLSRTNSYSGLNRTVVDKELAAGRPVVVAVMNFGHYVVIKGKSGSGYIMNDPWYANGRDIPLNRYYSNSSVSGTYTVRVN